MDDFFYNYCQKAAGNSELGIKEKKIYQIQIFNQNIVDKNMRDLASFYAMCGNYQFGQYESQTVSRLMQITGQRQATLPYHNAIAFFQRILELNSVDRQLYTKLKNILPYVLACRGFVFGTAFYVERLYCLHPCDLNYVINLYDGNEDMYTNILRSQAELQMGYSFRKEKNYYSSVFHRLADQKGQIEKWLGNEYSASSSYPPPWQCNIGEIEKKFWSFWGIYSNYCTRQVNQASQLGNEDILRIKADLVMIKTAAQVIFRMERILSSLKTIMAITDKSQNIQNKVIWLDNFQTELTEETMQSGIDALKKIGNSEDPPKLYDLIVKRHELSMRQLEKYPILNRNLPIYKLNKSEGKELRWHRRTAVARIIDWLCRGAKEKSLRKIMPFYLLDLFANDKKPLRPFKRNPHYFHPAKLKFQGDISFCTHPTVIRTQESHYFLYQNLLAWCDCYFKEEWDRPLCNALYTFYRCHLVTKPPAKENYFLNNDLSILEQALWRVFDMSPAIFPQRTQSEISVNEFYDFYYYTTDPDIKAVRKALQKLVTDADVGEYKELAFLDAHGIGYSFHPAEWFDKIEQWLSKVASRDEIIMNYITSEDSNAAFHQAQIDLAIQFICCQKMQKHMTQEVLKFCKRIFSPNYQ